MKEYPVIQKTFVKSSNKTTKIYTRIFYTLMAYIILISISYFLLDKKDMILPLLKALALSLIITTILAYFINIAFRNFKFTDIYKKDNVHIIAIIIGLFAIDSKISILTLAILASLIVKKIYKKINLSAALYGILLILLYKYYNHDLITPLTNLKALNFQGTYIEIIKSSGGVVGLLLGTNYLSPVIPVLAFIYLFSKKSLKYGVLIPYITIFSLIMLMYGLFNNMNTWFLFFELATGNILFLALYTLTDYQVTPTILEGQILYGIILALISAILRFIIPELSIVITFILGPLLFTRIFELISPKLKYHPKFYRLLIGVSMFLTVGTIAALIIIK